MKKIQGVLKEEFQNQWTEVHCCDKITDEYFDPIVHWQQQECFLQHLVIMTLLACDALEAGSLFLHSFFGGAKMFEIFFWLAPLGLLVCTRLLAFWDYFRICQSGSRSEAILPMASKNIECLSGRWWWDAVHDSRTMYRSGDNNKVHLSRRIERWWRKPSSQRRGLSRRKKSIYLQIAASRILTDKRQFVQEEKDKIIDMIWSQDPFLIPNWNCKLTRLSKEWRIYIFVLCQFVHGMLSSYFKKWCNFLWWEKMVVYHLLGVRGKV